MIQSKKEQGRNRVRKSKAGTLSKTNGLTGFLPVPTAYDSNDGKEGKPVENMTSRPKGLGFLFFSSPCPLNMQYFIGSVPDLHLWIRAGSSECISAYMGVWNTMTKSPNESINIYLTPNGVLTGMSMSSQSSWRLSTIYGTKSLASYSGLSSKPAHSVAFQSLECLLISDSTNITAQWATNCYTGIFRKAKGYTGM